MRLRTRCLIPLLLAASGAQAASAQPITSRVESLPEGGGRLAATAVVYSKSFLQERYMQVGKTVGYALFVPGVFQQAVWRASGQYEGKAAARAEANAFEKLLGDFDVTARVGEQLPARLAGARHFDFAWAGDAPTAEALIGLASSEGKPAGEVAGQLVAQGRQALGVFKVSYGFGARAGREQLGFKKTYRPFVRLLGVVFRPESGERLWHGAVIAWAEKGYKGKPDARAIPSEELVAAFTAAGEKASDLLLRSLDGETLEPMGELVDETAQDGQF